MGSIHFQPMFFYVAQLRHPKNGKGGEISETNDLMKPMNLMKLVKLGSYFPSHSQRLVNLM